MSVKKEKLIEIYFLRSISCLAIVLTHSIGFSTKFYTDLLNSSHVIGRNILDSLNLLLKFGTPMFVFISILLLIPRRNPKGIPPQTVQVHLHSISYIQRNLQRTCCIRIS